MIFIWLQLCIRLFVNGNHRHSPTTNCMAKIPNAFLHHPLHGKNTKRIPPPPTAWQKSQAFPHHPLHGINSIYDRIFFINFLNQYSRNVLFWNENSKSTWIRVRLKIKNITVMQIFRSEHTFFFNRQQTLNPVNVLC